MNATLLEEFVPHALAVAAPPVATPEIEIETGEAPKARFDTQTGKPIPKFDPQTGKQNW